ncbi:MAG: TolC family protein, partial [Variovorax sp.]
MLVAGVLLFAGCTVTTPRLNEDERARVGAESQTGLFAGQEPLTGPLTLSEAVARAIKYQADYRQRQMEQAVAEAQLDVAKFDLLPRFTA